jgi:hypothetical protein
MISRKVWYYDQFREIDKHGVYNYTPIITFDINEAIHKQGFRMASYGDLTDVFCATGIIFRGVLEVSEGFFLWVETDCDCDYQKLDTYEILAFAGSGDEGI